MNTTKTLNRSLVIAAAILLASFAYVGFAHANPFYTASKAKSATSTTTVTFMTPGTATSTVIYDSYEVNGTNETNQGNLTLPDFVSVAIQGVASSTSSIISAACEYSDDNVDWYQNEIFTATSSPTQTIGTPVSVSFAFSTTTIGGLTPSAGKYAKVFTCPVPLRYVRAVVTDTGAAASVYTTIIPTKQRN